MDVRQGARGLCTRGPDVITDPDVLASRLLFGEDDGKVTDDELPCQVGLRPFGRRLAVWCPCVRCTGILRSDGRNGDGTLTFLQCDACGCTYVAEDKKEEAP